MKKIYLFLATLTFIAFTSCDKEEVDGYYNPKDKISKIYREDAAGNKHLFESWNWDKKQLKSIEVYNDEGNISNVETYYYYGDGRISMVYGSGSGTYSKYYYKDELLDYIELYYDEIYIQNLVGYTDSVLYNVLGARFDFSYNSDNRFTEIKATEYKFWEDVADKSISSCNPLRFILSDNTWRSMKEVMKYNAKHSSSRNDTLRTTTMTFEWSGDNISRWTSDYYHGSDTDATYIETYQYDDKTNPYSNLYDSFAVSVYKKFSNENNVTRCSTKLIEGSNELPIGEQTYTYEYEKDLPIKRVSERIDEGLPIGVGVLTSGTYHYEYK